MTTPPPPPLQRLHKKLHFIIPDWRLFFKTRWKVIGLCLIGVLLLEIFIFNLPTWQTLRAIPSTQNISSIHTDGIEIKPDGLTTTIQNATLNVTSKKIIKYLYLQVSPKYSTAPEAVNYTVGISYQGDQYVHWGAPQSFNVAVKESRYINAGSYVHSVTLQINEPKGTFIPVTGVVTNPRIPYRFSLLRLCLLLLLASFWILLGPGSVLWKMELNTKIAFHFILLSLATLGVIFLYFVTWYLDGNNGWNIDIAHNATGLWTSNGQYARLADALLHGHTYLDLPVSPGLKALKNPYSLSARLAIGKQGQFSFWDHAFYHGKYYCYYGIIPALIFFVPYQFLTGHYMTTGWAILIALTIACIFATLLIVRIAKLYFEDASLAAVLVAIWVLLFGSATLQEITIANFYPVPQACSYMFTILGLWCWLKSLKRKRKTGEKYVSSWWIFFGSLFIACNFGCRPQFVFFGLLAIPIFWTSTFKDRTLYSRKGIWPTIFSIIPFFLVFIPLFLYNYDRFGSIFNFGENYNLTDFDMIKAKRPVFPFLLGITVFYYWFQPMNIIGTFPYVTSIRILTPLWYPSFTPVGGGYFTFMAPCVFLLFATAPWIFARRRRKELDRTFSGKYSAAKSTRGTVISLVSINVAAGICASFATAQWVGYTQRYSDFFGLFFAVASIFILFSVLPTWINRERGFRSVFTLLKILLVALLTLTCIWEFLGFSIFVKNLHYFRVASWFLFMN